MKIHLLLKTFVLTACVASASIIQFNTEAAESGALGTVKFNAGDLGQEITGKNGGTTVVLRSNEDLLVVGNGQARVLASDGAFQAFTVALGGGQLFDRLVIFLDVLGNGTLAVTATGNFGMYTDNLAVKKDGQNTVNIEMAGLDRLSAVSFESTVGIANLGQVRIGDNNAHHGAIPEPATYARLGSGLITLSVLARRRAPR